MRKPSKNTLIKSLAVASTIGISAYCYIQNNFIKINKISYTNPKLPIGFDGLKVLHVSDLHNKQFGRNQKRIIDKIKDLSPDIIVVTGDIIDRRITKLSVALEFVKRAIKLAPIYYVTGNHEKKSRDYAILKKELAEIGVNIIDNSGEIIEKNDCKISIIGLGDPALIELYGDMECDEKIATTIRELKDNIGESDFTILLSHRPEYFPVYAKECIDICFTGHSHGGQIRIPYFGGMYAPGQGIFPEYCGGVFHIGDSTMISNRGLGNTSRFPIRINNRPELVLVTLRQTSK